jgi:hypothetical protein
LLDVLAATVRAADVTFFVVDEGKDFGEHLLTAMADELVVGHRIPPMGNAYVEEF